MQNINSINYLNITKVINIESERLFREAEDDFYYFNKINSAYKKLKQAVSLTPNHLKSILLLADIIFMKGNIKKSLRLYTSALKIKSDSFKIYASIANCYKSLNNYEKALEYCNLAFELKNIQNFMLFNQLLEIKIEILISMSKYKEAYFNIFKLKKLSEPFDFNYEFLHNKIERLNKLAASNLQIV